MQKLMDFIIGFALGALAFYVKETLDLPEFMGIVLAVFLVMIYFTVDALINRKKKQNNTK